MRRKSLMYVLSAIVLLNLIFIIILSNKEIERAGGEQAQAAGIPSADLPLDQIPARRPPGPALPEIRTLILDDPSCIDCFDIAQYLEHLEFLNTTTEHAKADLFAPARLPAIAFNASIERYPTDYVKGWESVGEKVTIADGAYAGSWYVLPTLNPPFRDTATNEIRGRVAIIYLTMESCAACYDVAIHKTFLNTSRIFVRSEERVDIATPRGAYLAEKYRITNVPTLIMDGEASVYGNIQPGWKLVGTIEPDGSYVLRDLQRLKVTYWDLEHQILMEP